MKDETKTEAPALPMPQPALAEVYMQREGTPAPPTGPARWDGVAKMQTPQPVDRGALPDAAGPFAEGWQEAIDELRAGVAELRAELAAQHGASVVLVASQDKVIEALDKRTDELATIVAELRDELGEVD